MTLQNSMYDGNMNLSGLPRWIVPRLLYAGKRSGGKTGCILPHRQVVSKYPRESDG
jgi:hypothetical protein